MDSLTRPTFLNTFAISISFIIGAPIITLVLLLGLHLAGDGFEAAQSPTDWFETCIAVAVYAGFAGILVDLLRLVTTLFWRKKIPFRLKLGKVLKDNLA
jgi:hypothetical protein